MSRRPFRFGITIGTAPDMAAWTSSARRAESLGYSTFLVPDTLNTLAPLPALAAAAAATTSLRVGTWVLCDALRNPRTVAWEIASLDRLSAGRVELGIGAGRPGAEQDARRLGLPYGTPGERINRLSESVTIIRHLLDGGEPDFPAAAGRVPILIAASGPRMLRYAAQHADIVALGWPPTTTQDQARQLIEGVRAAAGDRFDQLELAAGLIAIGDDHHPWLERMGVDASSLAAAGAVTVAAGSPQQMADVLSRHRDTLGLSYLTVPAQSMDAFAPVVELLAGT
jgi:probable F420-dependent oxidoreductase